MLSRGALKALVPDGAVAAVRRRQAHMAMAHARRAFASQPDGPAWLEAGELGPLQARFKPPATYSYEESALMLRGSERAARLGAMAPAGGRTLEVGAGDGMVSGLLARAGLSACALDLSAELFDDRARRSGVRFLTGDAAAMPLGDDEFDLVFSYNSFEHFEDPEQVFGELIRVTRPGGLIHVDFGPLYYSAYGLHGYRSVHVPYSHLLFERPVLEAYLAEHELAPIPFETLNGWSVAQFRALWDRHAHAVERVAYLELPQIAGRVLIVEHPSCFRAKTRDFDDLLVAVIRATFRAR